MKMKLEFMCEEAEVSTKKDILDQTKSYVRLIAYEVDEEEIMENLNFEDVMNYYGVSAVCEWCEANR